MTHEAYKELIAANALSALDGDDVRELEVHLEHCADCRSEMSELEETTAMIALGAKPVEPSTEVREKILDRIRAEQAGEARRAVDSKTVSRVLPFEQARTIPSRSFTSFGAIAAAIAGVAMLVALFVIWQQNRSANDELARLRNEMRDTNERLARQRALVQLLTSPGARMTNLAGTNVAPTAHAMLAYDKSGHAMLMAKGLPAAPNGMAYQLWFIKDNKKMPGKVFKTDSGGNGSLEDQIPASAMDSAVFAITLEPESGVQVPTGAIYLVSPTS